MTGTWLSKYQLIPFEDKGRSFSGCDCWGLVLLILKNEAGIEVPSFDEISCRDGESVNGKVDDEILSGLWEEVDESEVAPFDLVVLRGSIIVKGRVFPARTHIGILSDKLNIIHTEIGTGVVSVDRKNRTVRDRIFGYYRFKG